MKWQQQEVRFHQQELHAAEPESGNDQNKADICKYEQKHSDSVTSYKHSQRLLETAFSLSGLTDKN